METDGDRPLLWRNVNASIGYSGQKRAAVSRPQDRNDAGPSLANIKLRVYQLVKILVHLYFQMAPG